MPVARVIFEMLRCDTFENGDLRLIADYGVDCETEKHALHRALAYVCMAVFVVGQPVCLCIILFLGKQAEAANNQNGGVLATTLQVLSEVWQSARRALPLAVSRALFLTGRTLTTTRTSCSRCSASRGSRSRACWSCS